MKVEEAQKKQQERVYQKEIDALQRTRYRAPRQEVFDVLFHLQPNMPTDVIHLICSYCSFTFQVNFFDHLRFSN